MPDVVGFSLYIWNIEETIKVMRMLKKVKPDVKIIAGGPEVTYDYDYWLERVPEIDVIAIGEGERTFKHLLDVYAGKDEIDDCSRHCLSGKWTTENYRTWTETGFTGTSLSVPIHRRLPELSKRITYIETSRGCPFSCQFCLSSIEVGVRYFNRDAIKDDIRYLMANGAKTIKFVDRTFNISRSYAMEMFQFLIDEHVPGTVFQFEITGDIMRPEVIQFLK